MRNRSAVVSFGQLRIPAPDVVTWTCRKAMNALPTVTIRLNARSGALHALPLNERVIIEADGHGVFAGHVVTAQLEDEELRTHKPAVVVVDEHNRPLKRMQHSIRRKP